ncbi:PREDICTED: ras GTPase-activating protein-binding protein 2, partial [Papilio xuthus]|uniref:Ras GTPase-activating protein-binding protein 2 n=1 Tax=Papilio xuthus TaxID=66420 RepID=A0AAJ6Z759_PAPXU
MVMEASPSPQSVGREFVRQYYTLLNKAPAYLHRFYNNYSSFVHGGLDAPNRETLPVVGQKQIHNRIQQLNFRDCHAKISQVDSQATLGNGVVVQVTGELSNGGAPMRRFTQTFVLAAQSPKKYYVHNDIFRYQVRTSSISGGVEHEPEAEVEVEAPPAQQPEPEREPTPPPPQPAMPPQPVVPEPKTYANLLKSGSGGAVSRSSPPAPAPLAAAPAPAPTAAPPAGPAPPPAPHDQRPRPPRAPQPPAEGGGGRRYSDSQQLFLGNLPHSATEEELRALFARFGPVAELRVHSKAAAPGAPRHPNYGFITYETAQAAHDCLNAAPLYFPADSPEGVKLNVEEKK